MKASGNGDKAVCVQNLLAIVRGEVCFDRVRGLDPRIVDKPAGEAASEAINDAQWLLKTYEPRAEVDAIRLVDDESETASGIFKLQAEIT